MRTKVVISPEAVIHQVPRSTGGVWQDCLSALTLSSCSWAFPKTRLYKILTSIRTSGITPYTDLRSSNGGNHRNLDVRLDVDAFWHFCYHHISEPLADADEKARQQESAVGSGARMHEYMAGTCDGNPLAGVSMDVHSSHMGRMFMPPMQWAEVHNLYCLMDSAGVAEKVSEKLVRRVYNEFWEPVLGFRRTGQHARCSTCARLAKTRRDHPGAAERAHSDNEYKQHLRRVFAMRRVDARFSNSSNMSRESGCTFPKPMPACAH